MGLKIEKTAKYLPKRVWSNYDFEKILDTSNEWILNRTGIYERHFVDSESLIDLTLNSVKNLKLSREEIGKIKVIIVASCTSKYQIPNLSSYVQNLIKGEEEVIALDINVACSGFISGLNLMAKLLDKGESGLLIGAEIFSDILNFEDRSTSILFGDGSGACLISKNEGDFLYKSGIEGNHKVLNYEDDLNMNGREVYRFSIDKIPREILKFMYENNIKLDQVDHFIFHQANIRIIESLAKKLNIDIKKCPTNLRNVGNLSSASIPVLLNDLNEAGKIKRGEKLLLVGFGAGLSWGISYMEW